MNSSCTWLALGFLASCILACTSSASSGTAAKSHNDASVPESELLTEELRGVLNASGTPRYLRVNALRLLLGEAESAGAVDGLDQACLAALPLSDGLTKVPEQIGRNRQTSRFLRRAIIALYLRVFFDQGAAPARGLSDALGGTDGEGWAGLSHIVRKVTGVHVTEDRLRELAVSGGSFAVSQRRGLSGLHVLRRLVSHPIACDWFLKSEPWAFGRAEKPSDAFTAGVERLRDKVPNSALINAEIP